MASCSTKARRCRSRSATSSTPSIWSKHFGTDPVRHFFLREVSFGQDGSYSEEAIANRINADLADNIGNLAQRSLSMIVKNLEGVLPAPGDLTAEDLAMLAAADRTLAVCRTEMATQQVHKASAAIFALSSEANGYFAAQAPWALAKTDLARMATVLYVTAETVRQIGILLQPFVPASASKLLDLLKIPEDARSFAHLGEAGRLQGGTLLDKPEPVFPKYFPPKE